MATPEAALQSLEDPGTASGQYRLVRVRRDAALGVTWADVGRCDHPEWPVLSVVTSHIGSKASHAEAMVPVQLAIKAGEVVRVWRRDQRSSLEVTAVSEESGAVGDRIRLRLARASESGDSVRFVIGLVRGPADVEMER